MTTDQPPEHATHLRNHWYWRPGWREGRQFYTWHLTFEGQTDLHRLVTEYQQALADVPGLDLIPLEWLHLTMQGVGFTDEVLREDVHKIAEAVTQRLVKITPPKLTFSGVAIRPEAIALPSAPAEPLHAIRGSIRAGIGDVWGNSYVPEANARFDPHLSIAYVNTDAPAKITLTALLAPKPLPSQVIIREVSLIVLRRDGHAYLWDSLARASFGG